MVTQKCRNNEQREVGFLANGATELHDVTKYATVIMERRTILEHIIMEELQRNNKTREYSITRESL
jgi:hypothetical protein